jgi:hypothetical protein
MRRNKLPKQLKYQLKSLTKFPMMLNYKSKKILMMLSMNTNKMLNFQCYLNSSCYFRSQNPTPTSNNEMFPSIKPFTTAYKVLSKGESESYTMSHDLDNFKTANARIAKHKHVPVALINDSNLRVLKIYTQSL